MDHGRHVDGFLQDGLCCDSSRKILITIRPTPLSQNTNSLGNPRHGTVHSTHELTCKLLYYKEETRPSLQIDVVVFLLGSSCSLLVTNGSVVE